MGNMVTNVYAKSNYSRFSIDKALHIQHSDNMNKNNIHSDLGPLLGLKISWVDKVTSKEVLQRGWRIEVLVIQSSTSTDGHRVSIAGHIRGQSHYSKKTFKTDEWHM